MAEVELELKGDVAWIRLNREDRMNAFDAAMNRRIVEAIRAASGSGVIVLTGTGRAFCAGGYLARLKEADPNEIRNMFYGSLELFDTVRNSPRPVIAAVNGAAIGGGNELVVACDLAVAAESATFGQNGVRIGSAPVLGGTNLLAMSIGEKRTKEVAFLCRRYSAREALQLGWINAVVADDRLQEEVTKWADELLEMSPRYLEIAKVNSNVWWNQCRDNYLSGLAILVQAIGSEDMVEGVAAFSEKRKPRFRTRKKHAAT